MVESKDELCFHPFIWALMGFTAADSHLSLLKTQWKCLFTAADASPTVTKPDKSQHETADSCVDEFELWRLHADLRSLASLGFVSSPSHLRTDDCRYLNLPPSAPLPPLPSPQANSLLPEMPMEPR